MLKDGGLYLNHGIHHEFHWKRDEPDRLPVPLRLSERRSLPGLTETLTEMERARFGAAGRGEPAPALRPHLPALGERLTARADEARAIVGRARLPDVAPLPDVLVVAFASGSIGLYQVLMQKQWDATGGPAPRTREPFYVPGLA